MRNNKEKIIYKKLGFTLVELLAVIVILAALVLLVTPLLSDIIEDSEKNLFLVNSKSYLDSIKLSINDLELDNEFVDDGTYKVMPNGNLCLGDLNGSSCIGDIFTIKDTGDAPAFGTVAIKNGEIGNVLFEDDNRYIRKGVNGELIIFDGKLNYTKSIGGVDLDDVEYASTFLGLQIDRTKIEFFKSVQYIDDNLTSENSVDISENEDGSVMVWYEDEDNDGNFEVYMGANGVIILGENANLLFVNLLTATEIDLSNIDTSRVKTMDLMFSGIGLETLDLSSLDTSNVTSMAGMFMMTALKDLNLSNLDTSNVTSMGMMFTYCSSLESIDFSDFNTSNVIDMQMMFYGCSSLKTLNLSSFDTSKVTNVSSLFYGTTNLTTLDISNASFDSVTNASNIYNSSGVKTIYVKDETAKTIIESLVGADVAVTISR